MNEELFISREFTPINGWTSGIEGPACDAEGNLYAVNYERQHTIGKVTPDGVESVFVELPTGSIGNGIRFNSEGFMFIADYTNHNVLKVDMETRVISVHAHEPTMNQPNDLAIGGKRYPLRQRSELASFNRTNLENRPERSGNPARGGYGNYQRDRSESR